MQSNNRVSEKGGIEDATITLKCNNNCIFCPRSILSSISCGRNEEEITRSLRKIRKKSRFVTLTGGEVTIMPNFFSILRACKNIGFEKISIITNGRRLSNKKFAEELVRKGVSTIGISIYSTNEKLHDLITRVKGSCRETKEGITNILGRVEHLWTNITVSKFNCGSIHETIKDLYDLGVREFLLISVITKDKTIVYGNSCLRKQINKILGENLPNSKIIFRGFPNLIFNENQIRDFGTKQIILEKHNFKTFVRIDKNSAQKYFLQINNTKQI